MTRPGLVLWRAGVAGPLPASAVCFRRLLFGLVDLGRIDPGGLLAWQSCDRPLRRSVPSFNAIHADRQPNWPWSQSFLRVLTRRLEDCPAAIAEHPVAWTGGIAGIAQVVPDNAHAAALCCGEQPAHRNLTASALRPETTRVEALDCGGGLAVCRLTRAIVLERYRLEI
jgi:hypothetical protein